ncbi:ankyrin repeat-containing domain protein [Ilyonectria destructans]|nr:ankyrin repeat-containing domain protein [Ilyonectria destructans]
MAHQDDATHDSNGQAVSCISQLPNEILCIITDHLGQSDIHRLLKTCRKLASKVQPILLQHDIRNGVCNSLAWACYFGNASLARACLNAGVSPNVVFCKRSDDGHPDNENCDGKRFKFPALPSKFIFGAQLLYEPQYTSCSALALAVKRDHVPIAKLLLEAGADVIEPHKSMLLDTCHPFLQYHAGYRVCPEAVISHVRSVPMVELLLQAGGCSQLNHYGSSAYSPLEMILASCSAWRKDRGSDLMESELFSITRLLLEQGASVERRNTTDGGCLLGAISTRYLSVVKLVIESVKTNSEDWGSQRNQALRLALGFTENIRSDSPLPQPFRTRLLATLLDAGISPNEYIPRFGPPLCAAIWNRDYRGFQMLLERKAEVDCTDEGNLTPLSEAVLGCRFPPETDSEFLDSEDSNYLEDSEDSELDDRCSTLDFLRPLLRAGARIDHPSFHPKGFTPLMFATGDMIPEDVFKELLAFGADRDSVCRMFPGSASQSMLQCLLIGLPQPALGECNHIFLRKGLETFTMGLRYAFSSINMNDVSSKSFHSRRKAKFTYFTELSISRPHFYTEDGKHLLNWGIEELYGRDQEWVVDMIIPYYNDTRLPGDNVCPLWTCFKSPRLENYLDVGTLHRTCRMVEVMVTSGVRVGQEVRGETILHRVCKLLQTFPGPEALEQEADDSNNGKPRDLGESFSVAAEEWNGQYNEYAKTVVLGKGSDYEYPNDTKERYMEARLFMIGKLIEILTRHGANPDAVDGKGKTAFEYIEDDRILGHYATLKDKAICSEAMIA